jgi:4'-phosphopantetheinyl transferase
MLLRSLKSNEVHIWYCSLNQHESKLSKFSCLISSDEKLRQKQFIFQNDRRNFTITRGVLRTILGTYLNREPSNIIFHYSNRGKPRIQNDNHKPSLFFSVSHSKDFALYALSRNSEIGIDIENIRDLTEMDLIVEHFFSEREKSIYQKLSESKKREAFFLCWTRKEAYLKAIGVGLYQPLSTFEVSIIPGDPVRLVSINNNTLLASNWTTYNLKIHVDYASACVIKGKNWTFKYYNYHDYYN